MRQGTKPTRINHKDFDYHRSYGSVIPPTFPDTFITDSGLTMPNQETIDTEFTPPVPALYYGCTDEAQANLTTDLTGTIYSPLTIENITHANALGGYDIRSSLLAIKALGWITGFFNVQPYQLDMFDTIRLAMISGIPEKRSVSIGVPWFSIFENVDSTGILTQPENLDTTNTPWHNACVSGFLNINGVPYLQVKSWQGKQYGNNGWCFMSRSLINSLFTISGTVAFTTTRGVLPPITTIPVTLWEWLVSNLQSLLGLAY